MFFLYMDDEIHKYIMIVYRKEFTNTGRVIVLA
jgi:hypothetical protein